jgi:hypothetical protein
MVLNTTSNTYGQIKYNLPFQDAGGIALLFARGDAIGLK